MSDNVVSGVLSAVLCGVTGYGLYKVAPSDHPYAFTACVIGFCRGVMGLVEVLTGNNNRSVVATTSSIMDLASLPLVNIELYLMSESNNIALGHGLFIVPFAINLLMAFIKNSNNGGDAMSTLRTLTILGNITSMTYLCFNDNSWLYGGMAAAVFIAIFGSQFLNNHIKKSKLPVYMLGHSAFFYMTARAVGREK